MVGKLSLEEIDELLAQQIVGRIACRSDDQVYIIPISYAFDSNTIYCHGYEGKKTDMMRKNPKVCFQVDEMKDMGNWKSVLAWGDYKELTDSTERNQALKILLKRSLPIISSITTHLGETWPFSDTAENELEKIPGIVFKISIKEKTGRYESNSDSPLLMFN